METPLCPGCRERDARSAVLEQRVAALANLVRDLLARLGAHSGNSSRPPSATPRGAPKPVVQQQSQRRPGGPPGQEPHLKAPRPSERVSRVEAFVPTHCPQCHADWPNEPAAHEPPPTRFQTIELRRDWTDVTESSYGRRGRRLE